MADTKHTPGDWKLGEEIVLGFAEGDETTEPEVLTIIEAEGYGIIGYAVATPADDEELKANADLLASAPTLQAHIDRLEAERKRLNIRCSDLWDYTKELKAEIDEDKDREQCLFQGYRDKIDRLEAENKQVKELIADNLKQIGELKHYLHERGDVIVSLEAEKAELVRAARFCITEFERIEKVTPFTQKLPQWWHIWNDVCRKARTALAKTKPQ